MPQASEKPKLIAFDPELEPHHAVNRRAAEARHVTFDVRSGFYTDEEGRLRYDFRGQPLRGQPL